MEQSTSSGKAVLRLAEAVKLADEHLRSGRYGPAEDILRRLAQVKPRDEGVLDRLIHTLFLQERIEEAMHWYDAAVSRGVAPCDRDYDALYRKALLATNTCPAPLKRRGRFSRLLELLSQTLALDGSVAECGCYRGMSSCLLLTRLHLHDPRFNGRGYHVFDSFQGLGTPTEEDDVSDADPNAERIRLMSSRGTFRASLDEVKRALSKFPGVEYHPGWIPLSFNGLPERRYRFVHVDVDLYDPTLGALEYFYPRMTPGGRIVCDDFTWPGARRAIEEFCASVGIEFTVTPYEQAVIARP